MEANKPSEAYNSKQTDQVNVLAVDTSQIVNTFDQYLENTDNGSDWNFEAVNSRDEIINALESNHYEAIVTGIIPFKKGIDDRFKEHISEKQDVEVVLYTNMDLDIPEKFREVNIPESLEDMLGDQIDEVFKKGEDFTEVVEYLSENIV